MIKLSLYLNELRYSFWRNKHLIITLCVSWKEAAIGVGMLFWSNDHFAIYSCDLWVFWTVIFFSIIFHTHFILILFWINTTQITQCWLHNYVQKLFGDIIAWSLRHVLVGKTISFNTTLDNLIGGQTMITAHAYQCNISLTVPIDCILPVVAFHNIYMPWLPAIKLRQHQIYHGIHWSR